MLYQFEQRVPSVPEQNVFIAPSAVLIGSVLIHTEVSVWFNAVIRGDNDLIEIGEGSNVQDGAIIHTDPGLPVRIGRRVTIGHKAMLHGCEIGDGSLIGMNAVVLNRARIGKNVLVGANALIPEGREIPDGSMVLGSPGRVIRVLSSEEQQKLAWSAQTYIDKIARYRAGCHAL